MNICVKLVAVAGILLTTTVMAEDAPASQAPAVTASPDDAARHAAAERYLATQDENANFDRLIAMLGAALNNPQITDQQRKDFIDYARAHLDRAALNNVIIDAMMQTYTLPELTALGDFYGSAVGKQISAKSNDFQMASIRATIPVAFAFLKSYAAECTDRTKCIDLSLMVKK